MELSHLILEALNLMLIGMLFVGTFLGILVFLIPLLNKIIPDDPPPTAMSASVVSANDTTDDQAALVAVISAAVQQYRKAQR